MSNFWGQFFSSFHGQKKNQIKTLESPHKKVVQNEVTTLFFLKI